MFLKNGEEKDEYGRSDLLLQISPDRTVRWVRNGETVRVQTQETGRQFDAGFTIGNKSYRYVTDLTVKAVNESRRLYRDIHGRYVLDMKERYPIFDSCDAASENRYYHWYLVLESNRMSMVYYDDGGGRDEIIEDIGTLPAAAYRILNFWHYLDADGILRLK